MGAVSLLLLHTFRGAKTDQVSSLSALSCTNSLSPIQLNTIRGSAMTRVALRRGRTRGWTRPGECSSDLWSAWSSELMSQVNGTQGTTLRYKTNTSPSRHSRPPFLFLPSPFYAFILVFWPFCRPLSSFSLVRDPTFPFLVEH